MNDYAIEVHHLVKRFGDFTAVDNVNFIIRKGEIFGFLGANGAGKSTTIRMLCALLEPTSGTALVGGYDVNKEPEKVKANIGYMSQRFSLYEDLTVEQNIHFFGGVYGLTNGEIKKRKDWVLEMANLRGQEKSLTRDLPGGWKQRLALGCAILHQPKIVFLDEPTSGVDPVMRRTFWELINQLSEEGATVFVTTHYLEEAEYCNTIMLINGGKIIAGGSPRELKMNFIKNPILEVECEPVIEAMDVLQREPWVVETSVFGTYLHVSIRDEKEAREKLQSIARQKNFRLQRIDRISPSLEDVFIHLLDQDLQLQASELPA